VADVRFGSYLQGGTGPDVRFGSYLYTPLAERTVGNITIDSAVPGTVYTLPLQGDWDAADKVATLNGIALTLTDEGADFIEFTVPEPYGDGSSFDTLALNTVYAITVDDSAENPTSGSFRIDAPAVPYYYISSITGSPWNQSSVLYLSGGVSNGDSLLAEVLAGGPMTSFATNGSWVASNPIRFRVKAFNADGWQASWATFSIGDNDAPLLVSATTNGTTTTLTFDEVVYVGTGTPQLAIGASLGATTADYTSGAGTAALVFTNARSIGVGETAFATYTQPGNGLESVIGDDVSSFSNYPITNGSEEVVTSFLGSIPNRTFLRNTAISPWDLSVYWLGVGESGGYPIETGTMPDGLTLNIDTGVITGTPTTVESQALSVTGVNGAQTATSNVFTISVTSDDSKPRKIPRKLWS